MVKQIKTKMRGDRMKIENEDVSDIVKKIV